MQSKIRTLATRKAGQIYLSIIRDIPEGLSPSEFAGRAWVAGRQQTGARQEGGKQSLSGKVFELVVAETLAQNGILPFYAQAQFLHVPHAIFDFVCYHPETPVALSVKSSLRERYKQAVLEAMFLKQVYRHAHCYLITANQKEAERVNKKIAEDDSIKIEKCVLVNTPDFDNLVKKLRRMKFGVAESVKPVEVGKLIGGQE